jgi:hypothetical protein
MLGLRGISTAALTLSLATVPFLTASTAAAAPKTPSALGTVVSADHARVGDSYAEAGTTVYGGDRLTTDPHGSVQIRVGAARLLVQSASIAAVNDSQGAPSAQLVHGTATFSTGNSKAFTLYASKAAIRAVSDSPTIGQVTYLNDKELLVISKRGAITITVEGQTETVTEGSAYHVTLDPAADSQDPAGAGAGGGNKGGMGGPPLRAGRSYFLITAIGVSAIVTAIAVHESLESASRP